MRQASVAARLGVACGVGGLLLCGLLLPIVGGIGLAVRTGAQAFDRLPAAFRIATPPMATRILAADGTPLALVYAQDRIPVPLARMSPLVREALVATEDARFYRHGALDLTGIFRALVADLVHGGATQGGSTLTEQYVKNVREQQSSTSTAGGSLGRKLIEAKDAVAVERHLSKDQILERYLNIVYFGAGAYGVEAAAHRYFSVTAARLTLPEAALLAGLVQSPTAYDPLTDPQAARQRRAEVLARMAAVHDITPAQQAVAAAGPLGLRPSTQPQGCVASPAPLFCAYVVQQLLADPALGRTPAQRRKTVFTGGLTVRTTMWPPAQSAAQHAVDSTIPDTSPVATAVDLVQPGTGYLLGMAQNRPFGTDVRRHQTMVNLADGGASGFPAGSTFKLFVLAAALEQHIPLSTTFNAPPSFTATALRSCSGAVFPPYHIHNAEAAEGGVFAVPQGTWESVNTFYLQLEQRTGICAPTALATALGVHQASGAPLAAVPSFTLGSEPVSPLAMAAAYAAFAAHGRYCHVRAILRILGPTGRAMPQSDNCQQIVDPQVADTVTGVLRGVIDGPDPARTGAHASIGRPAAGKTGTTEQFSAAWFDGYTPQLAGAVWVGDPRGGFAHPLTDVTINGAFYPHVFGADLPATIWARAMSGALAGVAPLNFTGAAANLIGTPAAAPAPRRPRHHG